VGVIAAAIVSFAVLRDVKFPPAPAEGDEVQDAAAEGALAGSEA
jgi:hypothetical protein